jgi:hypothetical protein
MLYHTDEDFTEANNLVDIYPDKLQELIELWWSEAEHYGVFPLDGRSMDKKMADMNKIKAPSFEPTLKVFYTTETPFHGFIAPDLRNENFEITVKYL